MGSLGRRGLEEDLGLGLKRKQKEVNLGSLDGRENPLGVEGARAGVVALDLAGSDWSNRWEVFTQGAAIVKLNPEESVITVHGEGAIKGKIT